jgi:peptide-methionine (S)-S-oxide reductase
VNHKQIATFGGGCFWKIEHEFFLVPGVLKTSVGYMGGDFANPSYLDVVARITGHAEVAQLEYDRNVIEYEELLQIFWQAHDPTSLNRQGADRGEQYRSVIFYHTVEQSQIARRSKQQQQKFLNGDWRSQCAERNRGASEDLSLKTHSWAESNRQIVTEIKPAKEYYLATEDHQQYLAKKSNQK